MPYKDPLKRREFAKSYYHKNKDKILEQRKYHNVDQDKKYSSHLNRKYKLSEEEYKKLVARSKGRCEICGKSKLNRKLAVDHNHRTNKVRGLLCDGCNRGLAYLDNSQWLKLAYRYLKDV